MIEYDCETTGFQPYSQKQEAFLFIFWDGDDATDAEAIYREDAGSTERIQHWFDRAKDCGAIRAHNAKFDRSWAEWEGFDVPGDGMWHDSMLVAQAINERRSVALEALAEQLLGKENELTQTKGSLKAFLTEERRRRAKIAKAEGTELVEPNYKDAPRDIMTPYALGDVILTKKISDQYDPVIEQTPDLKHLVEFERKAMDALYAVEKRGLPASAENYRKLEIEVIENLERLEERVADLAAEGDPKVFYKTLDRLGDLDEENPSIKDFNPRSTPQILAALKARGADMSYMSEYKGKVSADAENLRAVHDDLAAAILDFRSEFKVLSTYVRPMIGRHYETSLRHWKEPFIAPDGRIHATYRQVGARTGRMSCADPNMQNQPRDDLRLRYNIVADPGYKLVAADLSNIEMVLFAAYAGEGRLLDAVRNGEDLHVLTAKALGLTDRVRPGGVVETARQLGKTYNFSRVYGGGLRTIRRQFRCSMDQARWYKQQFDNTYPEVSRLQDRIYYRLHETGYIQDKLISQRRFRVDPDDAYKATNYLVQGTAAALLKYALIQLHADGVPVVALVHDEVVAHVPEKDAPEVAKLITKRLTEHEGLREIVPLRADADIIDHWSDAKPLTDEAGRKYLFTPKWAGGEKRYLREAA